MSNNKKLIVAIVIAVFAWGWYSDYAKRKQLEEINRQNAEAAGEFFGGFLRGLTGP